MRLENSFVNIFLSHEFLGKKCDQYCPASYTSDIANHSHAETGNKKITKLQFGLMLPFNVIFSKLFIDAPDSLSFYLIS